ncbi:MAG TPA: zinc-binding dehydrogenase, partial [Afifellaceae bacterium]|nr:zinc-binding dehydrogenase [Afifellaceae bacterium]
ALLACGVITGYGAVANTAHIEPGSDIVVIGAGGVGLNAIQGGVLCAANRIVAVDISDDKLDAAMEFGATHGINSSRQDAVAEVRSQTGGRGADYVFITVGAKPAFDQSYAMLARGGAAVLVGMPANGVMSEFEIGAFAGNAQRILGSKMGSANIHVDIPALAQQYLEGRLKLDELISGRYPLADIDQAIASVKRGEARRNVILF